MKILGVSPDPVSSHRKFKEKYGLQFTLLADVEKKVLQLYEAWGEKTVFGRTSVGVFRTTYVIDPEGQIVQVFENVRPDGHAREVLELLEN